MTENPRVGVKTALYCGTCRFQSISYTDLNIKDSSGKSGNSNTALRTFDIFVTIYINGQ